MINHYTVDMKNPESWDQWYFNLCQVVASNSKCLSRKIGAIIVRDKRVISTGYNGPPVGVRTCDRRWLIDYDMRQYAVNNAIKHPGNDGASEFNLISENGKFFNENLKGKCPRYVPEMGFKSGEGLEWCVAGHAERNAICNAARLGISTMDTQIYMSCGVPCTPCLIEILNCGINEIIVSQIEGAFYDQSSKYLLAESGIKIRTYDFIED